MGDYHVKQLLGPGLTRTVYKGPDFRRAATAEDGLIDRGKAVRVTRDGATLTLGSRPPRRDRS